MAEDRDADVLFSAHEQFGVGAGGRFAKDGAGGNDCRGRLGDKVGGNNDGGGREGDEVDGDYLEKMLGAIELEVILKSTRGLEKLERV